MVCFGSSSTLKYNESWQLHCFLAERPLRKEKPKALLFCKWQNFISAFKKRHSLFTFESQMFRSRSKKSMCNFKIAVLKNAFSGSSGKRCQCSAEVTWHNKSSNYVLIIFERVLWESLKQKFSERKITNFWPHLTGINQVIKGLNPEQCCLYTWTNFSQALCHC